MSNEYETGDIIPIEVLAVDSSGDAKAGLTAVNLSIRSTSDQWFDFSTNLYRDSTSVVSFTTAMAEVDSTNDIGKYRYVYNSSTFAPGTYQARADNTTGANFPQAQEFIIKEVTAKRLLDNKLTISTGATSTLNLFNDSGTAIIRTWVITDASGNAASLNDGPPSNRGTPTT
jgi:hypothetical protein